MLLCRAALRPSTTNPNLRNRHIAFSDSWGAKTSLEQATAQHAMDSGGHYTSGHQSQLNLHSAHGPVVRFAHEEVQSMCVWAVYIILVDELACSCRHKHTGSQTGPHTEVHKQGDKEGKEVEMKSRLVHLWIQSLCHACSHPSDVVACAAITALANLSEFLSELVTSTSDSSAATLDQ